MKKLFLLLGVLVTTASFAADPQPTSKLVANQVDWSGFLNRHDLVFDFMPSRFENGAFLGNGLMGAMIYGKSPKELAWGMGRSDVTERRRDNARLPIGDLVLTTVGTIQKTTMRLDLWNAEIRGTVTTDKGTLQFRSLIHAREMVLVIDLETTGEESGAVFSWKPGSGQMHPKMSAEIENMVNRQMATKNGAGAVVGSHKEVPNPPGTTEVKDGIEVYTQKRQAGGEYAIAWKQIPSDKGKRVYLNISDSFPANTAQEEAVATVKKAVAGSADQLVATHQDWWHAYYPKSFVSIPDTKLESYYWIQLYKLACNSRPDGPPVDLPGVWFSDAYYSRIWWNLNIQILYSPVYTANHLDLGTSLVRLFDDHRQNFVDQAKQLWNCEDGASVSHTTDNQGKRGDGVLSPPSYLSPGDFPYALYNYYQHYRYSMDHSIVTDHKKHAFYPLLRGAMNVYLQMLVKGEDGKWHLPLLYSPEYGKAEDANYTLSSLQWGLQTLIALNERYQLNDPLLPKWKETLKDLVAYPTDENGLMIGAKMPLTKRHRHWSHLLMVNPLQCIDLDDASNRELVDRSMRHWLSADDTHRQSELQAWSRAGAASIFASLGDGGNAYDQLSRHMSDGRWVRPNTIYIEGSSLVECSIVAARSLQDMLLQSHGNMIKVFPAIPAAWPDAVFHDLLAEGAFEVSAERKGGKTHWVRIKSLAGEPCRVSAALGDVAKSNVPIKVLGRNQYELTLAKGEEAILYIGDKPPEMVVKPLPAELSKCNLWGAHSIPMVK